MRGVEGRKEGNEWNIVNIPDFGSNAWSLVLLAILNIFLS